MQEAVRKSTRHAVAIYREELLSASETFILSQAVSLRRYRAHFIGVRRVEGLALAPDDVTVLDTGSAADRMRMRVGGRGRTRRLERAVRSRQVSVVHAHFGPDALQALALTRRLGLPLVTTFQGYDATMHDDRLARLGPAQANYVRDREVLARDGTLFLAVSDFIRRKLLDQGFPPEKVRIHYTGIDTHAFHSGGRPREPLVLFVGRLVEKKGVRYLIEAFDELRQRVLGARLVIIGDGPLRDELEAEVAARGMECIFTGWQSSQEVRGWMDRARVLCTPSVTAANGDSEGLPNVVFEAAAMGLPTVGFAHAGIPEMVIHGQTGFLVKERDSAGLTRHLVQVLEQDGLWASLSAASRRRARDQFDQNRQSERLEEIYDQVRVSPTR